VPATGAACPPDLTSEIPQRRYSNFIEEREARKDMKAVIEDSKRMNPTEEMTIACNQNKEKRKC
jgi:hypothetical protein